MHPEVSEFIKMVKGKFPKYFKEARVLEVGSLDINGSIRSLFEDCDYTGLDIGPGPGVDIVCPIHMFHLGSSHVIGEFDTEICATPDMLSYKTVISTEMLEHDQYWKDSLESMYSNLRSGGILILTCAGPARQEHGTTRTTPGDSPFTNDYYRNISTEDFASILPQDLFTEYYLTLARSNTDLHFYGIKK